MENPSFNSQKLCENEAGKMSVEIYNILRKLVPEVTILGVTLDNIHSSNICKKASKKLSALLRVENWLNHSQKKKL